MSKGIVSLATLGRFGNQCFQYAFARAYAERYDCELRTDDWIGRRIFDLPESLSDSKFIRHSEIDLDFGTMDFEFYGYAQSQRCMIYTKKQAQSWFTFNPDILEELKRCVPKDDLIVCHERRGDYFGYGYPVVSRSSYLAALRKVKLSHLKTDFVSEETPIKSTKLPDSLSFLPDFFRLMSAPILLRSNSSFSWWAATLGNGLVMSPVIEGLEGGKEHGCEFVAGNWPRFTNLDFVTDLHVQ